MIPILYGYGTTVFDMVGITRLSDCISCTVTEERNGIYECEFQYPINGANYEEIQLGRIIGVMHDDNRDIQPFDIYKRSAPISGIVTFYGQHISYRLRNVIVKPFTANSCVDALNKVWLNSINDNPFSFSTDKDVSGTYALNQPRNVRSILGGESGSLLDVYGTGEYTFDKWRVVLNLHRGKNLTEIDAIRYGVNLTNIVQEIDQSGTYNRAVPFWTNPETGESITLPEYYVTANRAVTSSEPWTQQNGIIMRDQSGKQIDFQFAYNKYSTMDLSAEFSEAPTVEQLRARALSRLNASNAWLPYENLEVDFVALWQTEDYKDVSGLQHILLCDRVNVYHEALGVKALQVQVIRTVYNALLERYDRIELGQPRTNLNDIIKMEISGVK